MSCNTNLIELLNIDFSQVSDEFNWINTGTNPVETVSGQLKLKSSSATSEFRRGLGVLDATKNRVRLKLNMNLFRPQDSTDSEISVKIGVYLGANLINEFEVYQDSMSSGSAYEYNFERDYFYSELSGNISLKITIPSGFNNEVYLDYLIAENYFFCEDSVRTYFIINDLFSESFSSVSSAIQLLQWKVDGVETLTPDFFSENNSPGGNPLNDWLFSKSEIDGSNRISENTEPNSFNPFVNEWGLEFDTINSFYGGKPTGTVSGSDYGSGILEIGFLKPEILNGLLESKKGAFFIDIDYSKNLLISFDVLVNDTDSNPFNSPKIFRRYFIVWNASNCTKQFYYTDQASDPPRTVDVGIYGFLYGLTGSTISENIIGCNESFNYQGGSGVFEFTISFGTDLGYCGIDYNAYSAPDKFEIEYNGQIYSTGYVGEAYYNQQLINNGVPNSEINTESPSNGSGSLIFPKTTSSPTTATIRVTAPLESTSWSLSGVCPEYTQTAIIFWNDTQTQENRTGQLNSISVGNTVFGTIVKFQKRIDAGAWVDIGYTSNPQSIDLDVGVNEIRLEVIDEFSNTVYSNILQYTKEADTLFCKQYRVTAPTMSGEDFTVVYNDCNGVEQSIQLFEGETSVIICASEILYANGLGNLSELNTSCTS